MAVGDESIGFGATVEFDDDGDGGATGGTYTEVPKVTSLGVPSRKTGIVESKPLDLPAGVIRKLSTLADGGEFAIKVQHTNAQFARFSTMREAHRNDHTYNLCRVTVPDDDGDTEIIVPVIVTECKLDPLESEKITEFEVMCTVQGASPDEL